MAVPTCSIYMVGAGRRPDCAHMKRCMPLQWQGEVCKNAHGVSMGFVATFVFHKLLFFGFVP